MHFLGCLHCEGKGFVGTNQQNVIVSGEVRTGTGGGCVRTMQKYDLCNGPPAGLDLSKVILSGLFWFGWFRDNR